MAERRENLRFHPLLFGCRNSIITTMDTTIKVREDTRRKLKLLAALLDRSMTDILAELVDKALKEVQGNGSRSVAN